MIPIVTGVSELQRNGKKALAPIKERKRQLLLLAERNHVFGVVMSLEHYEELTTLLESKEADFWQGTFDSSLDFWNDKSNDVYEKCL
jgi:hypothetical protein